MIDLIRRTSLAALIAGGALFVSACGGGADDATTNDLDTNILFEEPANDQSALESTANVTDVEPVANEQAAEEENEVEENDNGMVESNVAGM